VAVGRAIVRKPKVFLFDEPLSNLDAKLRGSTRTEIIKLHNRLQATMIYVTHDQVEAMTMGDRIVVMKDGYVQQIGDPVTIYDRPANKFVAGFIGTPPMNFLNGRLEKKDSNLYFGEGSFTLKLDKSMNEKMSAYAGKEVVLGVRPEDIEEKRVSKLSDSECKVSAMVDVIEHIGSLAYVYLTVGQSSFVAALDSHEQLKVSEKGEVVFNMEKAHFFDSQTEATII